MVSLLDVLCGIDYILVVNSKPQYYIFGIGGHAKSTTGLMIELGLTVSGYLAENASAKDFLGKPVFCDLDFLSSIAQPKIAIAIGDNYQRFRIRTELLGALDKDYFPNFVHPRASLPMNATMGCGNLLFAGSVVGYFAEIEDFCLINTNSVLEHDSRMASFSSLAPGACIGGSVMIGTRSSIGLNSTIKHGITIGDDSVIGAHSFLSLDFPNDSLGYGVPAKVIRERIKDEKYL